VFIQLTTYIIFRETKNPTHKISSPWFKLLKHLIQATTEMEEVEDNTKRMERKDKVERVSVGGRQMMEEK